MTKRSKLIERFMSEPKDFSFSDLVKVFASFGYELQSGKGSHVGFYNESTGAVFHTWKSHGRKENTVPRSDIRDAVGHLKEWRLL